MANVYKLSGSVTLAADKDDSTKIQMDCFDGGSIYITSGASLTTITWYASPDDLDDTGTYYPVLDADGVAVTSTIANGQCAPLPSELNVFPWIKGQADNAGACTVVLKRVY